MAHGLALLSALLLLLLGERFTEVAHAVAQGFHSAGLIIDGFGQITLPQRALGVIHRFAGAAQRVPCGIPFRRACSGQVLGLALQFLAQFALALGEGVGVRRAFARARPLLLALLLPLTLALLLALALTLLPLALLALLALSGLLALLLPLTLLLALLLALVELILKLIEAFVAQPLLLPQCVGKIFHGLLARALVLLTLLALGDLHVLHHLAQLF